MSKATGTPQTTHGKNKRITYWDPEDNQFWEAEGKRHAYRNLWISVPALMVAFIIWQIWSVIAVRLNEIGFNYTDGEIFMLTALPGLLGATSRLIFTIMPSKVGGKTWTVISTLILLIPAIGIGIAVQNPETPFMTMAILSALCGLGGGNFSSSMANISFFFPKRLKGLSNGINAGVGNLGVSIVQFMTPILITTGIFASIFGAAQTTNEGTTLSLQNAAFFWVIPILVIAIAAYFGMDNLSVANQTLAEQTIIFKNKHTWIISLLYTAAYGSFIGFAAAFGLLMKYAFPDTNLLGYIFLGPLVGAAIRPVGGWIADKLGGAKVTLVTYIIMILATLGVMHFTNKGNITGYFIMFLILFLMSGSASGSIFQMVPSVFIAKQAATVLGFIGAIAAFGAFFIPMVFKNSVETGANLNAGFYIIIAMYLISLILCWYYYTRKNAEAKC